MKAKDFLSEFDDNDFPRAYGPWRGLDSFDPPWTMTQLNQMDRQGIIQFNSDKTEYRLTMKAVQVHRKFNP